MPSLCSSESKMSKSDKSNRTVKHGIKELGNIIHMDQSGLPTPGRHVTYSGKNAKNTYV